MGLGGHGRAGGAWGASALNPGAAVDPAACPLFALPACAGDEGGVAMRVLGSLAAAVYTCDRSEEHTF